jgi:hypothetical protein
VYTAEDRIAAAKGASWVPSTRQEGPVPPELATASVAPVPMPVPPPAPPVAPPVASAPATEEPLSAQEVEIQILDVIQDALKRPPAPPSKAAAPSGGDAFVDSPLFSGFSRDELVAVIRGLELMTFEPGDIVITEGDAGDSLFVITEGRVKAFVRDAAQHRQMLMRELKEGDFFGEISILSGKPRSATVTAVTHCEMLELDRATLDEITARFPHVRQVLEEFYLARAMNTAESPGLA